MSTGAESRRQLVHASMTVWIVALRWLDAPQAMALAGAAIVLNWLVLPLTGLDRGMRREGGPWVDGAKLYPVAVFLLVWTLPLPAAAAGWAVMGIGDAASNVAGRRWGTPPFLGRKDRSAVGTGAFVAAGWPAAALAYVWVAGGAGTHGAGGVAVGTGCAAIAGAAAEYVPLPRWLDDNLPIALAAGIVAYVLLP